MGAAPPVGVPRDRSHGDVLEVCHEADEARCDLGPPVVPDQGLEVTGRAARPEPPIAQRLGPPPVALLVPRVGALIHRLVDAAKIPDEKGDHVSRFPVKPTLEVSFRQQAQHFGTRSSVLVPALGGRRSRMHDASHGRSARQEKRERWTRRHDPGSRRAGRPGAAKRTSDSQWTTTNTLLEQIMSEPAVAK